jgi:ribonuclease R
VGVLFSKGGSWFVEPTGRSLHEPVLIRDPHVKNARAGDMVVIELLHYPEEHYVSEGVIVRVLGEAGKPDVETAAVMVAHGLRTEFPGAALDHAARASRAFESESRSPKAFAGREDLRKEFTFTIDPPDAKDFDDAISIAHDEAADTWTLGVHIADVAHFVRHGSPLDEEARERGNSVYLPRLVVPMLPEVLSNGVCSLQEGVPRLTQSAFIRLDGKGKVLGQRLASTVISSSKRLTYLEAQALIDGNREEAAKHARAEPKYSPKLIETLKLCDRLARILQKRRRQDGMIELNLPEVELVFDDEGHVKDAVPEDDAFTHKIIEMFMVEANEALARTFVDLDVPLLRRVHPEPIPGDIEELRMYARGVGIGLPDEPTREDLQRLLAATRDTPAARAIHFAVLRTLATASYSPAIIGHYALGSDHYAHFTSPIRRYPDLTVHRVTEAYAELTGNGRNPPPPAKRRALGRRLAEDPRVLSEDDLVLLGRHCSETEKEAEAAERELRDFLVMQFLEEHHMGHEFTGAITGITSNGLYVSLDRFLVEGLVRMQDLPQSSGKPDRWTSDPHTGRLVAARSGAWLAIGDVVTVSVLRVDLATRHLDLTLVKLPAREAREGKSAPAKHAKPAEPDRPESGSRAHGPRKRTKKKSGFKQGRRGKRGR